MASIQTWSSAVGSLTELQGASDQSHQLEQMQGLEHLSLSLSDGNLTVANDGQIPSTLDDLRLVGQNDSKTIAARRGARRSGAPMKVPVEGSGQSVEVVTSLGNVFVLSRRARTRWGPATGPDSRGLPPERPTCSSSRIPTTVRSSSWGRGRPSTRSAPPASSCGRSTRDMGS